MLVALCALGAEGHPQVGVLSGLPWRRQLAVALDSATVVIVAVAVAVAVAVGTGVKVAVAVAVASGCRRWCQSSCGSSSSSGCRRCFK